MRISAKNRRTPQKEYKFFWIFLFSAFCGVYAAIPPGRYQAVEGEKYTIPYLSNHLIDKPNPNIKYAMIGIHGSSGDAWSIYNCTKNLVDGYNMNKELLILTPTFMGEHFLNEMNDPNLLYWKGRYVVWTWGLPNGASVKDSEKILNISTFDIIDKIIKDLCSKKMFPNLQSITLLGNSAGGQFTNHYAVLNSTEDEIANPAGIKMNYVIMNPLSYLYLDERRPKDYSRIQFDIPGKKEVEVISEIKNIARKGAPDDVERLKRIYTGQLSGYDNYGYGLKGDLTGWLKKNLLAPEILRKRYKNRKIMYLIGREDDTIERTSYEAFPVLLQGRTRLERAQIHYGHLLSLFGEDIKKTQYLFIVPESGHGTSDVMLENFSRNKIYGFLFSSNRK